MPPFTNAGYTYDNAGNLTNDGSAASTYDALNRMTQRGTTTHTYNGDGTLVSQASGGITTRYTQDLASPLSQVLQTKVGSAAITDYRYGLHGLASLNSGVKTWYTADALGSVRRTVSDSGTPQGVINYDPWGTPESGSVPTFGFTGELQDVGAGLVNLRARWYSTGRGRFTSADSWMGDDAHSQSLNLYGYVGSNPVGLTDPSGHCYPPIEYLRQLEPLNCSNIDQAARIIKHPNASAGDKAKAGAYVGAWAFGHAGVLVGLAFAGGGIAAEIGTAVASSTVGTSAGNLGLLVAAWAANYLQMHPDVAAGIQAAAINTLLYEAYLHKDQTAQSALANPIAVLGCNLWGEFGEVAAAAFAESEIRILPRRPGLRQRVDGGLERGQLTDDEFYFFRRLAMARRNQGRMDPIVLTGSMSETDLGFLSRYDKNLQANLPDFRKNKPASGLVETYPLHTSWVAPTTAPACVRR
jgi:RHS repeat-associated protein